MNESNDPPRAEAAFQKVAECLYRNVSSGRYYAFVKRGRKQYRRSLKTTDRKVAERFLADFRQHVSRLSSTTSASQMTFRGLATRWIETLRAHLKPASLRRREISVVQIASIVGGLSLRQVTSRACEEWANKRSPGIKASTYNNERDTLRSIMEYGKREGLLLDNPAEKLPRRKLPRHSPLIPSQKQFANLIQSLRRLDSRYQPAANLAELLAYSGMRQAEATSIRWRDVDFENGRFTVTGGETGTKNHEAREIPLFPALRAFLEALRVKAKPLQNDLIASIGTARKALKHACTKAELPVFTHHTLRHYFVSN